MVYEIDPDRLVDVGKVGLEDGVIPEIQQSAVPVVGREVGMRQEVCSQDGLANICDYCLKRHLAIGESDDDVLLPVATDWCAVGCLKASGRRSMGQVAG